MQILKRVFTFIDLREIPESHECIVFQKYGSTRNLPYFLEPICIGKIHFSRFTRNAIKRKKIKGNILAIMTTANVFFDFLDYICLFMLIIF